MRVVDHYTRPLADGRILCEVCPRACKIGLGQRGLCYVRQNVDGHMVLTTDGLSSGFCVDPIEKKPLFHFLPGSSVLSFGTAGCNLACAFCQNHEISKSREIETSAERAGTEAIARAASGLGCASVAFTYNDPVIFYEYAIAAAAACHARGVKTVAVTAGYMRPGPRAEFYAAVDAANVDLKSFSDDFYHRLAAARLEPVLDTLKYIRRETNVWLEITTLLIPGENDARGGDRRADALGGERARPDMPLHRPCSASLPECDACRRSMPHPRHRGDRIVRRSRRRDREIRRKPAPGDASRRDCEAGTFFAPSKCKSKRNR